MGTFEKVIFDTNIIRNIEHKNFLGGRDELKKFSKVAEIIFPDIVIEELKSQKIKQLENHKRKFLQNPFHWLRNMNQQETESFDNEAYIADLESKEDIKYSVIKLQDYSVLEQIKELAIKKLPPFEESDNTDKGFKDAYIYFTIIEYLQSISDKYIFVCTKDGRLKEALQKLSNVRVVKDFEEFRKMSISSFYDEYFINQLKDSISPNIMVKNITDYWLSIDGNHILLIEIDDKKFVVEVDQREIISFENTNNYDVNDLINSGSFAMTHSAVAILDNFKQYFSDDEIINILEATTKNNQIYRIISDDDVKQFISDLFEAKKDIISNELKTEIENLLK